MLKPSGARRHPLTLIPTMGMALVLTAIGTGQSSAAPDRTVVTRIGLSSDPAPLATYLPADWLQTPSDGVAASGSRILLAGGGESSGGDRKLDEKKKPTKKQQKKKAWDEFIKGVMEDTKEQEQKQKKKK